MSYKPVFFNLHQTSFSTSLLTSEIATINFRNRSSNGKLKRRHLGWHPRAQLKPNPEPFGLFGSVY
jgi:hypothetical protein